MDCHNEDFLTSWPWPMTLTYKPGLDIHPFDLQAKIQVHIVRMSVCSAVIVVTDTHTHRRCQNYYTHHIRLIRDVGCKNGLPWRNCNKSKFLTMHFYKVSRTHDTKSLGSSDTSLLPGAYYKLGSSKSNIAILWVPAQQNFKWALQPLYATRGAPNFLCVYCHT